MDQQVYFVDRSNKRRLLADLLADPEIRAALIFVRNKHVVDRVTKELSYSGIRLLALHGDRSVGQRQAFLDKAKEESRRFWIATDIAARGLDFAELSHVIHLDVPNTLEAYLERMRYMEKKGTDGKGIVLCDQEEKNDLESIEKGLGKNFEVVLQHPYPMTENAQLLGVETQDGQGKEKRRSRERRGSAALSSEKEILRQEKKRSSRKATEKSVSSSPADVLPKENSRSGKRDALLSSTPETEKLGASRMVRAGGKRREETFSEDLYRNLSEEEIQFCQMKAVDHVVIKGLPTIRENRGEKEKLETCEVRGYDELPKPKAGQKLLTSFSDSGVEYLLSEDPSVDQRIFQTLGFYVPPKDAMEQIFGKNYRSLPEEDWRTEESPSDAVPFSKEMSAFSESQDETASVSAASVWEEEMETEENLPLPNLPSKKENREGRRRSAAAVSREGEEKREPSSELGDRTPGARRKRTPRFSQKSQGGSVKKSEKSHEQHVSGGPSSRRKPREENGGSAIKTRSQQMWYADTVVPDLKEKNAESRKRHGKPLEGSHNKITG